MTFKLNTYLFLIASTLCNYGFAQDSAKDKIEAKKALPNKLKTKTPKNISTKDIYDPKNSSRYVRLRTVIEEGLRENPQEKLRRIQQKLATSELKDIKARFWFPDVNFFIQTDDHRVGRYSKGSSSSDLPLQIAQGSAGISFGEYTLFNWGKDFLSYLNEKDANLKQQRNFKELTRELRHILIVRYFKLAMVKEFEQIHREKLQHASFIYRLTRERAPLRKATQQEYYQARSEYLKARKEYQQAQINSIQEDEQFAFMLGDHLNTTYRLKDQLKTETLTIHFHDVVRTAINSNPKILDARVNLNIRKRDFQRILKDNLPLPELKLNLGAYSESFGKEGSQGNFQTNPGSKSIDLVASVNFKWSILGPGGLFNFRKSKQGRLKKQIAEQRYINTRSLEESNLRQIYKQVLNLEDQLKICKLRLENAQKTFDTIFENYRKRKTRYLDFRFALSDLADSQKEFNQVQFLHLERKVRLATTMGVEDLPGQRFDELGVRKK